MANSADPDQTAPIGAVCSGSMLFASILNLSVMLGNYLQQTISADDIFRCIFFLGDSGFNLLSKHHIRNECYRKIKSVVIQTEFVSFSSTVTLANRLK